MSAASIIARIDRELTAKRFRRKGSTWNRERGPLVEVVDIQTGKGGDYVTMNAGVLSRPVFHICWGRDAQPFVEEPFCTVRTRVGRLLGNRDIWWDVGSVGVAEEMVECLATKIIPFLEGMGSMTSMRSWLAAEGIPSPKSPQSSICFAVLESHVGDMDAACSILAELEVGAMGMWKVRAREVAVRIGCKCEMS